MMAPLAREPGAVSAGGDRAGRASVVGLLLLLLVLGVSAAVGQVWTRLKVIDYGYKISRAITRQRELTEQHRRLKVELALLRSPQHIKGIATRELGLAPARPEQFRRICPDGCGPRLSRMDPP